MPLLVESLWPALDVVHDLYRYVRRCHPNSTIIVAPEPPFDIAQGPSFR